MSKSDLVKRANHTMTHGEIKYEGISATTEENERYFSR